MAISVISEITAARASDTTLAIGNPGDEGGALAQVDDLLVAMISADAIGNTWTPPAGWVQFHQAVVVADFTFAIFSKVVTAAETGDQFFDFVWGGSATALVGILTLVREPGKKLFIEGEQNTVFTSGLSYVAPSYTTIEDNQLIFRVIAAEFIGAGPATFDVPGGTVAHSIATNGMSNPQLKYYTDTAIKTPPGATGTKTFVATVGEASVRVRIMTFGMAVSVSSGGGGGMGGPGTTPAVSQPGREGIERGMPIKNPFGGRMRRNACLCIGKCVCS